MLGTTLTIRFIDYTGNEYDAPQESLTTFEYDDRSLLTGFSIDRELDGTVNGRGFYAFDDQGHMLSEAIDSNDDGVIDFAQTSVFDAQGRLTHYTWDVDGDAGPEQRVTTYSYGCH